MPQCKAKVHSDWRSWRCSNNAQSGSEYCGVHDPNKVDERRAAREARDKEKWAQRKYEIWGKKFYNVLTQIDHPLAKQVIEEFHR